MAEAPMDVGETNEGGLVFEEIREEPLQTGTQEGTEQTKINVSCDICFSLNLSKIAALYLCYVRNKYLCGKCYEKHGKSHCMVKLVNESCERETKRRKFLGTLRKERERERKFEREDVSIVDRVNVKHEIDQSDCGITVVCGLHDGMWLVSDNNNSCIKIFSSGSNILQRYIRFGSEPFGVTEIKVKREPTEQGIMSTNDWSDISVTNRAEPYKHSMLVVTLPWVHKILFIDITQNPAVKTKYINTKRRCRSIDFCADTIFTLCNGGDGYNDSHWFVSMLSTDGVTLKIINTEVHTGYIHYLAVCHGKIFITDWINHKVLCMNEKGKVVSYKTMEGSGPVYIYICASGHHKLYRRDYSLESPETLLDLKLRNLESPIALSFNRDKLYVSYCWESDNRNFVIVVGVL